LKLSNLEDFVHKSKNIHIIKYDYSKFIYLGSKVKGIIICKIHGEFKQSPNKHLKGNGCRKCGYAKNTSSFDDFIKKSKKNHKINFDYSKFEYKTQRTKSIIICPYHGDFKQRADGHMSGKNGCKKCMIENLTTDQNDYIKRSNIKHKFKYNYSKVNYINGHTDVTIICPIHGDFEQRAGSHLDGNGCFDCAADERKSNKEIFVSEANIKHDCRYDYSKFIYLGSAIKGIIICPEHGEFPQRPNNHLSGAGCPYCKNKNEGIIKTILTNNYIYFQPQFQIPVVKNKINIRVDFYLLYYNLIIEYNGEQHYRPIKRSKNDENYKQRFEDDLLRDEKIRNYCNDNNINLLEIDGRIYFKKKLISYIYNYIYNNLY